MRSSQLTVTVQNLPVNQRRIDRCTGRPYWTTEGVPPADPVRDFDHVWAKVRINLKGDGVDWLELTGLCEADKPTVFKIRDLDKAFVSRFAPLQLPAIRMR